MSTTDIKNNIDSEFKRALIQNHPHYPVWFAALPPLARQIITTLMGEELTPADILLAQDATEEEWSAYHFFIVIANGNPDPDNMLICLHSPTLPCAMFSLKFVSSKKIEAACPSLHSKSTLDIFKY